MMVSPDCGTVSKLPKSVWTTLLAIDVPLRTRAIVEEGVASQSLLVVM